MPADPLDKQLVEAVLSRPRRGKAELEEAKLAGLRPERAKSGAVAVADDDERPYVLGLPDHGEHRDVREHPPGWRERIGPVARHFRRNHDRRIGRLLKHHQIRRGGFYDFRKRLLTAHSTETNVVTE